MSAIADSHLDPSIELFKVDYWDSLRFGFALSIFGFLGFVLWAAFAELTTAAIAEGVLIADSRNKTVSHLEGGIVREILVKEGDKVSTGDVLLRLDGVQVNAGLERLLSRRNAALALEARLIAERTDAQALDFPAGFQEVEGDPDILSAMRGQEELFAARRASHDSNISILTQRISQYEEEIQGLAGQIRSEADQLDLIAEEMAAVREMVDKGLERRPRLLSLQRTQSALQGDQAEHQAMIARARQSIAEMRERIVALNAARVDEATADLREVQTQLTELSAQLDAARDMSHRLDVTAPVKGNIVRLFQNTPGGVVKPGEPILEMIPEADTLVIEAAIKPDDIDSVRVGATTRSKLTAYSLRRSNDLLGEVTSVSADRVVSQNGGRAYYLARITIGADEVARHPEIELYPGMTAEVFVDAGKQTVLDYLLLPLIAGMDRAFREP